MITEGGKLGTRRMLSQGKAHFFTPLTRGDQIKGVVIILGISSNGSNGGDWVQEEGGFPKVHKERFPFPFRDYLELPPGRD